MVDMISMFKYAPSSAGMGSGTSEILSRIKFIGRIQKGEKINIRDMCVQPDTWVTSIMRTIFATEGRMGTFNFIDNVIKLSFELIKQNSCSDKLSERSLVVNIIADLKLAVNGIGNLKETYKADLMFCCKLDTLIQEINSRLAEHEEITQYDHSPIEDVD
jgi:hypothetical protein